MTDTLQERPGTDDARELFQQIAERQEELDAVQFRPPQTRRARTILLAVAIVAAGGFLAWDMFTRVEPPPAFDEQGLASSLEFTVYLTVGGIEEFRERTGELPTSLEVAGLDDPLVSYELGPRGYRVEASSGAHSFVFEEGDDLVALQRSFWALHGSRTE